MFSLDDNIREIDFVIQNCILVENNQFMRFSQSSYVTEKDKKELIDYFSFAIGKIYPVVNCYNYGNNRTVFPSFWMVDIIPDNSSHKSNHTITLCKIQKKRPVISIILTLNKQIYIVPNDSIIYKISLTDLTKLKNTDWVTESNIFTPYTDNNLFLRIVKSQSAKSTQTDSYIQEFLDYFKKPIQFITAESPICFFHIIDNKADLYPYLKKTWGWEIGAFDLLLRASSYTITRKDGISLIEYDNTNLCFNGFIAKNNYEYEILEFN